jgi:hypothetical protein
MEFLIREKRADIGRGLKPTIGLHFPVYSVRNIGNGGLRASTNISSLAIDEIC